MEASQSFCFKNWQFFQNDFVGNYSVNRDIQAAGFKSTKLVLKDLKAVASISLKSVRFPKNCKPKNSSGLMWNFWPKFEDCTFTALARK